MKSKFKGNMRENQRYFFLAILSIFLYCKGANWFVFEIELDFPRYEIQLGRQLTEVEKNSYEASHISALKKRIDSLGIDDAQIKKILPGQYQVKVKKSEKVLAPPREIFRTGNLEIKICDDTLTERVGKPFIEYIRGISISKFEQDENAVLHHLRKNYQISDEFDVFFTLHRDVKVGAWAYPAPIVLRRKPELSASDLKNVVAIVDGERLSIVFDTTAAGRSKLQKATGAQNKGKYMAIVFNQHVISSPKIADPITEGHGKISGNFTIREASNIASMLEMGALQIPFKILKQY